MNKGRLEFTWFSIHLFDVVHVLMEKHVVN